MAGTDYVVNPADPTSPLDTNVSKKGAAELRALKAYIATLVGLPAGLQLGGFKNRIINGDMRIDQANVGGLASVPSPTVVYSADMLFGFGAAAAGVYSMQQLAVTPPIGYKNYVRVTTTTIDAAPAVGSAYALNCAIEGNNLIDFLLGTANAIPFTISFWIRSSLIGQFGGCVSNGAANRAYPFTYTINVANTWEQKTVTLTGDLIGTWAIDNTAGLILRLDLGAGDTIRGVANAWIGANIQGVTGTVRLISTLAATLDITGIQIEKGSNASLFEFRDYGSELARCQRYFYKTFPQTQVPAAGGGGGVYYTAIGTFAHWILVTFPIVMRIASQTYVGYNPGAAGASWRNNSLAANSNGFAVTYSTQTHVILNNGEVGGDLQGHQISIHFTADARL